MIEQPIKHSIRTGYLGWSNIRSGLEFYRGDGNNNRWLPRENPSYGGEQSVGALLQDDFEAKDKLGEGSVCVVVMIGSRDVDVAAKLAVALGEALGRIESDAAHPEPAGGPG